MAAKQTIVARVSFDTWTANLVRVEDYTYALCYNILSSRTGAPLVEPLTRVQAARYLVAIQEGRTRIVRRSLPGSR